MENRDLAFAQDISGVIGQGFPTLAAQIDDYDRSRIASAVQTVAQSHRQYEGIIILKTNTLLLLLGDSTHNRLRAAQRVAWMISTNNPLLSSLEDIEKRYMLDTACQASINEHRKAIFIRERDSAYGLSEPTIVKRAIGFERGESEAEIRKYKEVQQALRQRVTPSPQGWKR